MSMRVFLTAEEVRGVLSYDPNTGELRWKISNKKSQIGTLAGRINKRIGYREIGLGRVRYGAHRLAWLIVYGQWPTGVVDHINGNPADNRIDNLREATHAQNICNRRLNRNSSTGFKGVSRDKRPCRSRRPYVAQIKVDGKGKYLGHFSTPEEAHAAYAHAAHKYHGEFARVA